MSEQTGGAIRLPAHPRTVLDTNVLISALLFSNGPPGRAVFAALERGTILISEETVDELNDVAARPKFDRYLLASERRRFVRSLVGRAEVVDVDRRVQECRDPKDDKFLSLALAGEASVIVSGDEDLLVLHPFRGIPVLTPRAFLAEIERARP